MKNEVIVHKNPKSPISEEFRTLRTNIQFMNSKKNLRTILITSTVSEEGKSWTTANLATTFAQTGKRTLIIDADMRKGRMHKIFSVDGIPGLSNFLSGVYDSETAEEDSIMKFVVQTEVPNLYLIPAGNLPPNPSELLADESMEKVLDILQEYFDFIVIDSPPSILVTDAIILSRIVDTTVIVSEYNETKKENLIKVKKSIENVGGKIAGVIINKVPVNISKYDSKYYYTSQRRQTNSTLERSTHNKHMENSIEKRNQEIINELKDILNKEKKKSND